MERPSTYRTLRVLAILFSVVAVPWQACSFYERSFYAGLMPAKLQLGWRFWHDSNSNLLSGCGVAAFSLSERTLDEIRREELGFFSDVKGQRNGKRMERFARWEPTPVPEGWFSEGLPLAFHCARWLDWSLRARVFTAMRQPGNYYSSENSADLMVLQTIGVVLIAYTD